MATSWLPRSSIQPSASTSRQPWTSTRSSTWPPASHDVTIHTQRPLTTGGVASQHKSKQQRTTAPPTLTTAGSTLRERPHSFSTCGGCSKIFGVRAFVTTTIMDHRLTVTYKACHSSGENITSRRTFRGWWVRRRSISKFAIAELPRTRQMHGLRNMITQPDMSLCYYTAVPG